MVPTRARRADRRGRREGPPARREGARPAPDVAAGPSIAILPFADLNAEKNQDWLCDGIAEEILNALTQLPGLRVAARTSAFSFRNQDDDLRRVGEKLGVATVLQGSVRRAGDRIRVTVQLADVANGFQLWSDRYDRELKDIFDVQDEVARAIAGRLKVTLAGDANQRLVARVTTNLEAYELLLMSGRHPRILAEMAAIHGARGQRAAAEAIYDELRTRAQSSFVGWAEQGAVAAAAGRMDDARALVERAIAARDPYLVFWKLPAWAPFRKDPDGVALLDGTGMTRLKER